MTDNSNIGFPKLEFYSIDEIWPEYKCQRLIIEILVRSTILNTIGTLLTLGIININKVPGLTLETIEDITKDIKVLLDECDMTKMDINIQDIEKILNEIGNLKFENVGTIGRDLVDTFYIPAIQCLAKSRTL